MRATVGKKGRHFGNFLELLRSVVHRTAACYHNEGCCFGESRSFKIVDARRILFDLSEALF